MKSDLSPKQVARAIGVSESSLKRWCDRGLLPTVRTPGGHRRLPLAGVLKFVKETGRELAEPEILGLPTSVGTGPRVFRRASEELTQALLDGSEERARRIVLDLFLKQHRLSVICDQVLAEALHRIGDGWGCGTVAVYEERRACEIVLALVRELKQLLPSPTEGKRAMGGTCEGDPYQLPTSMVALVLTQCGYDAGSLGAGIPFGSLAAAIRKHRPDLFWLSVSHLPDSEVFLENFDELGHVAAEHNVPLVVGGRALTESLRRQMHYTVFCDTLGHLESFLGIPRDDEGTGSPKP